MLNVTAREYGARLGTWETPQGELALPAAAHIHTGSFALPVYASLALAREAHPDVPTLRATGSLFTQGEDDGAGDPLAVPRALLYPASAGDGLHEAADEVNIASAEGPVQVAHRPAAITGRARLVVLPSARGAARDPWRLPELLVEARGRAGPNAVLYTPGIGRPDEVALAAYCGVDIVDGLVPVLQGLKGRFLSTDGAQAPPEGMSPCACDACREAKGEWTASLLVDHNRWALQAEIYRVKRAIADGVLRELVEARAHTAPELVATLRHLDRDHAAFFEERTPALREHGMPIVSRESLARPEIKRWVDRLGERYTAPSMARVLIVLPCSATKPYENSPTHQRIRPRINRTAKGRSHVVTLTSPIGAVPEELELSYPAAHYDIPVTGSWFPEERALVERAFRSVKEAGAYDHVVLHLPPEEAELIEDIFPEAVHTVPEGARPTDRTALDRLGQAVAAATADLEAVQRTRLFEEHMRSRTDWQFGAGTAAALLDGTSIKGKYPYLKLIKEDNEQVAMLLPERGTLVLTEEGGRRLAQATKTYHVEIDDFHPKGTVFAPGVVEASPGIRIGDEVALLHEGDYRGTGRAVAPGSEMGPMEHGPCVEVRHHA